MKFPAYGVSLWNKRLMGERPRVAVLNVGSLSRGLKSIPEDIPRLAVKTERWSMRPAREYDENTMQLARAAVRRALAAAELKPTPCEVCGDTRVEAHHPSYEQEDWLRVRWLCMPHHRAEHSIARRNELDWRLVVDMSVVAFDLRTEAECRSVDGWDEWFWLLADVQKYARDVIMVTPTIDFTDPPNAWAPERTLDVFAWLSRTFDRAEQKWVWPPWWPYGGSILKREVA